MLGCQWGDVWWLYKSRAVFEAAGSESKPADPGAGYQMLLWKKEEKPSGNFLLWPFCGSKQHRTTPRGLDFTSECFCPDIMISSSLPLSGSV